MIPSSVTSWESYIFANELEVLFSERGKKTMRTIINLRMHRGFLGPVFGKLLENQTKGFEGMQKEGCLTSMATISLEMHCG